MSRTAWLKAASLLMISEPLNLFGGEGLAVARFLQRNTPAERARHRVVLQNLSRAGLREEEAEKGHLACHEHERPRQSGGARVCSLGSESGFGPASMSRK